MKATLSKSPQTWEATPLKYLLTRKTVRGRGDATLLSVYRDYGVVPKDSRDDNHNREGKDLDSNLYVRQGDLVVNKMKAWQGSVAVSGYDGIVSPAYFVFEVATTAWGRFLHYQLRSNAYVQEFKRISDGVRPNQWDLDIDEFGRCEAALPALPTQKAIADFLDRKTAAIDALIEKKQKLLDLLAEKRAALINQAVTKGLDPNVPMKDSGIPWIGEIPAHWVVKRLQFACVLQRGFDLPSQARADGDVPIYGGGGITGHHAQAMVMPPGVVTGRYGTIGEVHLVDVPFWPLNTSLYVKQFWGNNAAYIRHLLSAAPMKMYSAKSAVPGVDRNDVHVIPVGMPPVPEQETIVAQLDARLAGLDEVVGAISTHVGRLQEYRQALITAAVTGKLRVEAAP